MALDEKQQGKVATLVTQYLDREDSFRAERRTAVGEINGREKVALDQVIVKAGKLDISKKAFEDAITTERHARDAKNSAMKAIYGEDKERAGQTAAVLLATGSVLPLFDDGKTMMEDAVKAGDEAAGDGEDGSGGEDGDGDGDGGGGDKVESLSKRRARKTQEEQEQAAQAGVGLH